MKELGLSVKATWKRKTKEEKIRDYEKPYEEAFGKLEKGDNDPKKAKLTRVECAAVLTLGFAKYTGDSGKLGELQESLKRKIDEERLKKD